MNNGTKTIFKIGTYTLGTIAGIIMIKKIYNVVKNKKKETENSIQTEELEQEVTLNYDEIDIEELLKKPVIDDGLSMFEPDSDFWKKWKNN